MQSLNAHFSIYADIQGFPLVIKDEGPWDKFKTVTNDAENVVETLIKAGLLTEGRPLYYFDTEGQLDEILIEDKHFIGFRTLESNLAF